MDNKAALAYIKNGGTVNQRINQVSKELWEFLIGNEITITAEYLPGMLNSLTDKESQKSDSSEWNLNLRIF